MNKLRHLNTLENLVAVSKPVTNTINFGLRWPESICLRVGYVFESDFSAGMILPISMIFGILNKEWLNFQKMLFIFF